MNILFVSHRKLLTLAVLLAVVLIGFSVSQTKAAENDSSIILKRDTGTGLFTLTIKDPDGIQEFSMTPAGKFPYGGGLSGCPKTFVITNTNFDASSDFEPVMPAYVIDCQNNTAHLELAAPKDGFTKSVSLVKEEAPPSPPPAPKEEPTETKKGGSLSASDITYPVKELGGCQNEAECRSYCDNSARAKECFAFAKKYNLITQKESEEAEKRFFEVKKGPGGCNSGQSCEAYCNTTEHLDACIAFAEESGYYSGDQLAEAKKFQELVKNGAQFPGGCKNRNTCELYCNDSRHMEECLNFAEESGFMPKDEIAQARKILPFMKRGETPGGCASREQCEKYCFEEDHAEECIAFGEKVGLISPEEAAMVKKTGGKGPGGCHSKEQCESYCEHNSDACFQWAQDNGLVNERDLARMKKEMGRFKEHLDKMPPEVVQCLKDAAGEKNFNKLAQGEPVFDRGLEGKMKACFQEVTSQVSRQLNALPPEAVSCVRDVVGEEGLRKLQSGEFAEDVDFEDLEGCFQKLQSSFGGGGPGGIGGGGGFSGPGGCKGIEECKEYCMAHLGECKQFMPPGAGGGFPGGGATGGEFPGGGATGGEFPSGPSGCKSAEECIEYCKNHPAECKNFLPPGGIPGGGSGGGSTGGSVPGGSAAGGGFSGGPGGCKSTEECAAYCQTHFEECAGFLGGTGTGGSTGSGSLACIPPPSGLVSWWKAEGNASDSVGGNSGAISGAVSFAPGKIGSAFKFGGGTVMMGSPANLNFGTGPFSLEAWFLWSGGAGVNNIIRKSNYPASGLGSGYWLRVGNGTLEFSVGETTKAEGQTLMTASVNPGIWHHAVGVKDGSGKAVLYVDGESRGEVVRQSPDTNATSDDPFTLGSWRGSTEFFSGFIDEVSVYNRALSASEVLALFHAGSAGKCVSSGGASSLPPVPAKLPQQIPQEYCASFATVPNCSYVGPSGSQMYEYCKQCFPDKAGDVSAPSGLRMPKDSGLFAVISDPFLRMFR